MLIAGLSPGIMAATTHYPHEKVASVRQMIAQEGGKMKIVGENAVVVLNQAGEVITTWALHSIAYLPGFSG